jgi:hypothetical protein
MFPRLNDGRFHIVCHKLRRPAVVMGAKSYEVDLSHGGGKIAKLRGEQEGRASVRPLRVGKCRFGLLGRGGRGFCDRLFLLKRLFIQSIFTHLA